EQDLRPGVFGLDCSKLHTPRGSLDHDDSFEELEAEKGENVDTSSLDCQDEAEIDELEANLKAEDAEDRDSIVANQGTWMGKKEHQGREGEKVDLKHQMMDERRNSEEWMIHPSLQQTVTKLATARKRKVALLVEAFKTQIKEHGWGRKSIKEEVEDSCMEWKWKIGSRRGKEEMEVNEKELNPKDPNFLPLVDDEAEGEKVDLKHQMMDERRNSEE
ncbi:Calmodulin binding protein PICBP, partial [Linum perenne]